MKYIEHAKANNNSELIHKNYRNKQLKQTIGTFDRIYNFLRVEKRNHTTV